MHITESQFKDRFPALILGSRDLPKKPLDLHILFISATAGIKPEIRYSETELNEILRQWTNQFGEPFTLDHVTLRRYLIDEKYILRDPAGTTYQLGTEGLPFSYDPAIREIDLDDLVYQAIQAREERKQRYLKESQ